MCKELQVKFLILRTFIIFLLLTCIRQFQDENMIIICVKNFNNINECNYKVINNNVYYVLYNNSLQNNGYYDDEIIYNLIERGHLYPCYISETAIIKFITNVSPYFYIN